MIDQLTAVIADQAKVAARKCAAFAVIGLVMLIGAGFLLAAIYMSLAASFGAVAAAIAIGGTLVTLGLVALAIIMQRDPGDAVEKPAADENTMSGKKTEDDVLFDLLVHSAMTGYATGQGNKPRMQTGFEQMVTDLEGLGVFDRPPDGAETSSQDEDADTKMAG